jgi:sugar transferase (PEP-CTERM/EpsH1 system associated)
MRILYVVPFVPNPPDKGERIRAFHQVRYLAPRHEVHLACLTSDRIEAGRLAPLEQLCASVHVVRLDEQVARLRAAIGFLTGAPASVASVRSRRFDRVLERVVGERMFDCIFFFSSSITEHDPRGTRAARVVDFVDVDSELWRQAAGRRRAPASWLYRLEAERLARHEADASSTSDLSIFVSDAEADLFRQRAPVRTVAVIPNGVDLDYFTPFADASSPAAAPTAVFIGTMDYQPNVDAVVHFHRDILPLLKGRLPSLRFHVVGRDPSRSVRRLGRDPQVTVTGWVPDVRPHLANATVMVAPFRLGRGIQNKILEAMASGVPVVGTSLALQGLRSPEDAGVRVADRPREFAEEMIRMIEDSAWHRECSSKGRRYVERHHQWDDHNATLDRILRQFSGAPSASGVGTRRKESPR